MFNGGKRLYEVVALNQVALHYDSLKRLDIGLANANLCGGDNDILRVAVIQSGDLFQLHSADVFRQSAERDGQGMFGICINT